MYDAMNTAPQWKFSTCRECGRISLVGIAGFIDHLLGIGVNKTPDNYVNVLSALPLGIAAVSGNNMKRIVI